MREREEREECRTGDSAARDVHLRILMDWQVGVRVPPHVVVVEWANYVWWIHV
jgi:hypothetical protein